MITGPGKRNALGLNKSRLFKKRDSLRGKTSELFAQFVRTKDGTVALETALITPFILWGMLFAGNLGLSITNHQKVFSGVYSGASYLHDQIAEGDLSGLNSTRNSDGEYEPGPWIKTAKLVIKDASGLPLDLNKVDIQAYCACPMAGQTMFDVIETQNETTDRQPFYQRENITLIESGDICQSNCATGHPSRIIAEIIVDFDAVSLKGGVDPIREKLVTRLR